MFLHFLSANIQAHLLMDSSTDLLDLAFLFMKNGFHELLIHEFSALCTMCTCLLSSFCSNCSSDCLTRPEDSFVCPNNLSSVFARKHLVTALPDNCDWTSNIAILPPPFLNNRLALETAGKNVQIVVD